jgi:hypothetical protein
MARHPLWVNCTTEDLDASMEVRLLAKSVKANSLLPLKQVSKAVMSRCPSINEVISFPILSGISKHRITPKGILSHSLQGSMLIVLRHTTREACKHCVVDREVSWNCKRRGRAQSYGQQVRPLTTNTAIQQLQT